MAVVMNKTKAIPLCLVASVLIFFVLWLAVSTESQWRRDDGVAVEAAHHVSLGLLSWVEINASRSSADAPWDLSAGLRWAPTLWTLALTLPAVWFWRRSVRRS